MSYTDLSEQMQFAIATGTAGALGQAIGEGIRDALNAPKLEVVVPEKAPEEKVRFLGGEVMQEVLRAQSIHKPMNSLHEGYAVLLEEVDELWDLVKMNRTKMEGGELQLHMRKVRSEAVQIAAMALRLIHDVIDR